MNHFQRLALLGCVVIQFAGCVPQAGNYTPPGQHYGITYPSPHYGFRPVVPIGYAPVPVAPGGPYVWNPVPSPGTPPSNPSQPGSPPTTPIGNPTPNPSGPPAGYDRAWAPWPLPPASKLVASQKVRPSGQQTLLASNAVLSQPAASHISPRPGGPVTTAAYKQTAASEGVSGDRDLKYRGGHTIQDLAYVNLYVSGDTAWSKTDVESIEKSVSAAMRDEHLNNVLRQYFGNGTISSTALPPHPLVGYLPQKVTRGDFQNYIVHLDRLGYLKTFDFKNTVFNLLLPPNTVLSEEATAFNSTQSASAAAAASVGRIADVDATDSTTGLAGYHGSVVTADGRKIYFASSVYSDRSASGATNGILVFPEAWKNVAATLYHQLIEVRTDPDVEDALRGSTDLNSNRVLGWVSDSGLEIGDVFNDPTVPVEAIIREVPLADGSGVVPIQLPYSNIANGVEGPIPQPHPLPSR